MAKADTTGLDAHQKEFVKLIRANAGRYRVHEVFRDFCEIAAISLSNAADLIHREKREARYLEVVGRYHRAEVDRFPAMLAALVDAMECGFGDVLGSLFMALELSDDWKGQFFTPFELALLMASMTLGDTIQEQIAERGFVTVNEPAAGAGAMVIALAKIMKDRGINYQEHMHVVAQDIDQTAVHMAYILLSLYHVPAIVVHGNTLAMTEWDHWATPAHILGGWDWRLRRRENESSAVQLVAAAAASPLPAPVEVIRAAVVDQRQKAEQLSLFG